MTTTTGIGVHDQNLERHIEKHMGGCMAGFFNLFDRSHLLSSKRLYPKRLPPPSVGADTASEPASSIGSPALSGEFDKPKPQPQPQPYPQSPKPEPKTPVTESESAPKSPLAVSTFEFKGGVKSPWKFNREAPRLSLDSRAVVDAKGGLRPREIRINTNAAANSAADEERENQRRSPSVVARLMGLEPILTSSSSSSLSSSVSEPEKKVELRRSASESRSRDYRFFDTPSFLSPVIMETGERKSNQSVNQSNNINAAAKKSNNMNSKVARNQGHQANHRRLMVERKSYYDTADFFPPELPAKYQQQQNQVVTIYGEIERRLRMRGIDEPSRDLETLKHILEALQLKGLLHSSSSSGGPAPPNHHNSNRHPRQHVVFEESPIVLMKPARPPVNRRRGNEPSVSPRRERPARSTMRSPGRSSSENRSSSPVVRRKGGPLSVETQRRGNETTTTTRSSYSPVQSPRMVRKSDQTVSRSPRNRRSTVEICHGERERGGFSGPEDEASTLSESSFSADNERWRVEEYGEGRNLLERCDKLLHSIAEMTSNSTELQQPSPVSVLDSSFYKEDESSPSPVKKRTIDFKDHVVMELEDEVWSPSSSNQLLSKDHDIDSSDDSDFSYVSEVLRASNYLPDDTDLFLLLENQSSIRGKDKSKVSILQRKLIFDTITEILDRNRQLPPWKAVTSASFGRPMLEQIWSEFQKIRERGPSDDLFEVIRGVLKKDLAGDSINGWGDCHVEMSDAVLDIERLIFKDLIGETIRDLAAFAGESVGAQAPRRKLVF